MEQAQSVRADESALIERLRRSDSRAWREFFSRHRDRIYGLCYRMLRDRTESEDATSEVFERAVRGIGSFRGDSSLNTWLYRIATNVCLTRIETSRRAGEQVELAAMTDEQIYKDNITSKELPAERFVESKQLQGALAKALDQLDPVFRGAIHLREVEGYSYEEIADLMGVPIETVKTRIHRGRMKLQQHLTDYRP